MLLTAWALERFPTIARRLHEDRLRSPDALGLIGNTRMYRWKAWMHERTRGLLLPEYRQLFDEGTPLVVRASASFYFFLLLLS